MLLLGIYYDIISSIRHSCLFPIETQINNKLKCSNQSLFFSRCQALLLKVTLAHQPTKNRFDSALELQADDILFPLNNAW